ncbi:uncharacterized protein HD556DRAFT_1433541 [Suillus plorans]|uniref:DDE-1 domain-containing protein n=1 Tax=Suillus plorans TaxID=116603 RepID=A0A9P7AHV1_9AGAM|nr:uncharacterized protein HD556DRAFT_1433541 [Suillus plorans]KAG1789801.1 hypothetical protein HD556DRAFT_1433541 [Suillus plorans]
MEPTTKNQNLADLVNYPSDLSNDEDSTTDDSSEGNDTHTEKSASPGCRQPAVPLHKRQKLDIPYHQLEDLESAFKDLEKLLKAKKTKACRARTMESHLRLVVKNAQQFTKTHGFAAAWGGRQTRELLRLMQGRHTKVYSLLSDPTIAAELRAYIRSNKWAMNSEKLAQFSQNKLIPSAANEYLHQITREEMPLGLKQYMELELFLCIHVKVGRGVSLNTARRWLWCEANNSSSKSWVFGDEHCLRKKGVGCGVHKSDVICSTTGWLKEASQTLEYGKNYEGYWTGEHFVKQVYLIICAMLQLTEKIIPAFERVHGAGHQALFLIDNSQGHSAYSEDALLTSCMNVKPGGKQSCMCSGWYWNGQEKVVQSMIFLDGHPKYPNQLKGIKVLNFIEFFWGMVKKYLRDNCDYTFDTLKENMPKALASVPLQTIHRWEHQMYCWMEAYQSGLGTKDAQIQVRKFSSTTYKSHRRIPDAVASAFD